MKRILLYTACFVLFFAGCGDGKSKNKSNAADEPVATIKLEKGVATTVNKGDQLIPGSADTKVEIRYIPASQSKEVTLIEGEAELVQYGTL